MFVGYRYYTSKDMPVLFPFGYGLSYTDFTYTNLQISHAKIQDNETLTVKVDVTNTGNCKGKEVIQLYISAKEGQVIRPVRELRAFKKISLNPGETKNVVLELDGRAFSYWNTEIHDWYMEPGSYKIQIGKSAQEILLEKEVQVITERKLPRSYTLNSTLGEVMKDERGQRLLGEVLGYTAGKAEGMDAITAKSEDGSQMMNQEMLEAMMGGMPLRQMMSFIPGIKKENLTELIKMLNE